jgi:hypothetical protein
LGAVTGAVLAVEKSGVLVVAGVTVGSGGVFVSAGNEIAAIAGESAGSVNPEELEADGRVAGAGVCFGVE